MWAHLRAAGLVLLWGWPLAAPAQEYPVKSIRLVVPFPPGGPNDVIGRVVGQKMQDLLGQLVIIDNRAGAGGALGTDFVAKSDPDGYTIAIASATSSLTVETGTSVEATSNSGTLATSVMRARSLSGS